MDPTAHPRFRPLELYTAGALGLLAALGGELLLWPGGSTHYEGTVAAERFFYDAGGGSHRIGLALAAWLVWRRRERLAAARNAGARAPLTAICLFGIAIALRAWSAHTGAIDLQLFACCAALLGGGAWLAGGEGLRLLLVPSAMVVVSAPIPPALVSSLIYPMQLMTARGVSAILDSSGVPHTLVGEQIFTGAYTFYVIEGCAGLRTLQSLAQASIVYLELVFRNRWQALAVVAVTPIVAIAVNQLRVLLIVLWPKFSLSEDHMAQGVVMIVLGVIAIAVFDFGLQRMEGRVSARARRGGAASIGARWCEPDQASSPGSSESDARRARDRTPGRRVVDVGAVALAAVLFWLAGALTPAWSPAKIDRPRAADLPQRIGDWRAVRSFPLDREFLGSVGWSDWVQRLYSSRAGDFELAILVDDHRERSNNILSTKVAMGRPGRWIESRTPVQLQPSGRPAERLLVRGVDGSEVVVFWHLGVRSGPEELLRSALALDQSLFHRPTRSFALRLAMPLAGDVAVVSRQLVEIVSLAGAVDGAMGEVGLAASAR